MSLHRRLEASWYSGSSNVLLRPFAALYGLVTAARRGLYTHGLLASPEAALPVIVVGNIAAGGTGKSPVVAWLVRQLAQAGYRPGIVSRGYGGRSRKEPLVVDGATSAAEAGDEPVMLAQSTGVPVIVCPDRVRAVNELARHGVDLVISDDGLQHYRMRRRFEIVVVDGQRRFGNGALLPAGPLREPQSRLGEVDMVLVNGGEMAGATGFELMPGAAQALDGQKQRPLNSFAGQTVWALAGIGNPQRFYDLLQRFGVRYDPVPVPDHGRCESLAALVAQKSQSILMTHKDAVKYAAEAPEDCWYVPVEVSFTEEEGDRIISAVLAKLSLPHIDE